MPSPQPTPVSDAHAASRTGEPVEIRADAVWKSFNGRRVLAGVSLDVLRGQIVAVVGGSGCGKTVLLEHIIGHHRPDAGRVLVADHSRPGAPLTDLSTLDDEAMDRLRMHWAVVFQRNALFSGSVYENIALWLRENRGMHDDDILPRARSSLAAVGFDPEGGVLEKDRDELSGGMAKRVAIARALAMDPSIVFYDEPTAGLDPGHAAQIHDLIGSTHAMRVGRADAEADADARRTTLVITHDKDLLRRLRPRVVMLHEGRVFFDGSYGDFERNPSPIIRPYFSLMPALNMRERG